MLKQIAGGEEARGVAVPLPYQHAPSLDMEQAMAMDPVELLASLLPDARGETGAWQGAGAYGALPQPPAHMHAHAQPASPRTTTPPMVPPTAESAGVAHLCALPPSAGLGAAMHGGGAAAGSVLVSAASLPGAVGFSVEHGQSAMSISLVPAPLAAGSRNGPERKEWTAAEDEIIESGVAMFGCKWRRIAEQLPGRSDDAVRNRWNRLKEARYGPPAEAAEAVARRRSSGGGRKALVPPDAPGEKAAAEGGAAKDKGAKPERMSWTKVGR